MHGVLRNLPWLHAVVLGDQLNWFARIPFPATLTGEPLDALPSEVDRWVPVVPFGSILMETTLIVGHSDQDTPDNNQTAGDP